MAAAGGTRMASMNSQELEDDLLWSESDSGGRDGAGSESEEPETSGAAAAAAAAPPSSGGAAAPGGLDIAGANNSHQSSTLRASLDESSDPGMPTPSPPVDVPGGGGGLAAARRGMMMHQQQQHHQRGGGAYARLGTSAPIAIPNMSAWRAPTDKASGGRGGDMAGTFIPPHQLSRHDDFTFSFTGASPSAAIKRERLRARNAILRSTGFLEPQAGGAAIPAGGAQHAAAAAAAGSGADKGLGRTSVQSSLTAALTTIGES